MNKKSIGFRKTALTKMGDYTPAKTGMVAGVGVVGKNPKKLPRPAKGTK